MIRRLCKRSALFPMLAALCVLLADTTQAPAKSGETLTGLMGIRWDMSVTEAIALFGRSVLVQQTKTSISDCYVQYAIPIRLLDEDWSIWLCEERDEPVIAALNFESANGRTEHFDEFLEAFTEAYGPAHSYWHACYNVMGNETVQYDWYLAEMRIKLIALDKPANRVVMRYERPSNRAEFGPGICIEPPLDLRRQAAPE